MVKHRTTRKSPPPSPWKKRLPMIGLGTLLVFLALGVFMVQALFEDQPNRQKKIVQEITLIKPPPPPPPELEPPPEPEIEEVEIPEPELEPEPLPELADQPPPDGPLGLDADGVAGSDGFGLVANRGGRGLIGGGGGDRVAWYNRLLQQNVLNLLNGSAQLRQAAYSLTIKLWLTRQGYIDQFELASSTGDEDLDRAVRLALGGAGQVANSIPAEMPQPVIIRLNSRI